MIGNTRLAAATEFKRQTGAERRIGAANDSLGNPDDGTQTIRFCTAIDRVAASRARGARRRIETG